jgi:uncharacterized heparinase superfamily protein
MSDSPEFSTVMQPMQGRGRMRLSDRMAVWRAGVSGPRVTGFVWQPFPEFTGSEQQGERLVAGDLRLAGHGVALAGRMPWQIDAAPAAFIDALHGFAWLDDLAILPNGAGRAVAQSWLADWLLHHGRGRGPGWSLALVAQRQIAMISHARFLTQAMPPEDSRRFLSALGRQAGLLQMRMSRAGHGRARLEVLAALVHSALTLGGMQSALKPALNAMAQACAEDIDASGALRSRNPDELLAVFARLTGVAALLRQTGKPADPAIDIAIARIAPSLRSLRHADGSLVRMHGGGRGAPGLLDAALARANLRPSRIKGLAMGYARLGGRRVSVIVDAAPPLLGPGSHRSHAATLAFELVSGREPVIVSAGSGHGFGPQWHRAGRATANHSTLSLMGYASARLARGATRADPLQQDFVTGPQIVEVQQSEIKTAEAISLSHDGWRATHGLVHLRALQLANDGSLLRGEDGLAAMTAADRMTLDRVRARLTDGNDLRFAVRFHLHPDAVAKIDMGGTAVSIQLPNRETWVFRHLGDAVLSLAPSVYLDEERMRPRATKQIVLSAALSGYGSAVSWTLARPVGLLPAPGDDAQED